MRLALAEAEAAAAMGEVPVGAVIVRAGRVLARTHNRVETDRDPTAHAEILAIRAALLSTSRDFIWPTAAIAPPIASI